MDGHGFLIAADDGPAIWRDIAHTQFNAHAQLAEFFDEPQGIYRAAAFVDRKLSACLFIGPARATARWDAVKALFESATLDDLQRRALLSGKSLDGPPDPGQLVCACFGVGLNVIRDAINSRVAISVDDVGRTLRAGTNCGSCLPELKRIVHAAKDQPPVSAA